MNPGTPAAKPGPGGTTVDEKAPATHRAASTGMGHVSNLPGGAPRGMWAVAWRLHRVQIIALLAVVAASAAAMILFRLRLLALYEQFDCPRFGPDSAWGSCVDEFGIDIWWSYGFLEWSQLTHYAMLAGPVVLGAFATAPLFTREFSRGTQVLALTQSVRPGLWFTTKVVIITGPLTAGLLLLGYLMEWMDGASGQTAYGTLSRTNFFAHGPIPAASGLMAAGLALAAGMITRTMVTTLVTTIIVGGGLLIGIAAAQPYVLPPERTSTPVTEAFALTTQAEYDALNQPSQAPVMNSWDEMDPNQVYLRSGYLDLAGKPVDNTALTGLFSCFRESWNELARAAGAPTLDDGQATAHQQGEDDPTGTLEFLNATQAADLKCATKMGISASYQDMLPGSMLWPLRFTIGGILAALAVLFTGIGAWRLRWAAAKR